MPAQDYRLSTAMTQRDASTLQALCLVFGVGFLLLLLVTGRILIASLLDGDLAGAGRGVVGVLVSLALLAGVWVFHGLSQAPVHDPGGPGHEIELAPLERDRSTVQVALSPSTDQDRLRSADEIILSPAGLWISATAVRLAGGPLLGALRGQRPDPGPDGRAHLTWSDVEQWSTSITGTAGDEIGPSHRIGLRAGPGWVLRAEDVVDNVALLDAVRAVGQQSVQLELFLEGDSSSSL